MKRILDVPGAVNLRDFGGYRDDATARASAVVCCIDPACSRR